MDSRRRSILIAAPALALGLLPAREAAAQALISEDDPTAKALGYKHDGSKVDATKFKTWAKNNVCDNCNFYKAKDAKSGPCMALGNKLVAPKGWCSAWVKKA